MLPSIAPWCWSIYPGIYNKSSIDIGDYVEIPFFSGFKAGKIIGIDRLIQNFVVFCWSIGQYFNGYNYMNLAIPRDYVWLLGLDFIIFTFFQTIFQ